MVPLVATLAACASPAPVAQNFPVSYQKVARTAHHWDVVALDVVAQTMQDIAAKPQFHGRPIYVAPAKGTAFNVAFRDFMITRLVSSGAEVSVCKVAPSVSRGFSGDGPDIVVQYTTQVVGHGARIPDYKPGALTALAAGVAVVRNIIVEGGHEVIGTMTGLALADLAAGHIASPTRTEIIVTTTIAENNRFLSRRSDVYYVPDADANLFVQRVAYHSHCPEDKGVAAADPGDAGSSMADNLARHELVVREMRRVNPQWRGGASPSSAAWSY